MCAHLRQKLQTLDNAAVEVDQFGFGEVVDVGGHDLGLSNKFEMQGRVFRVCFEQLEILVRQNAHSRRQRFVTGPERG
jgi:hypothetical protein